MKTVFVKRDLHNRAILKFGFEPVWLKTLFMTRNASIEDIITTNGVDKLVER